MNLNIPLAGALLALNLAFSATGWGAQPQGTRLIQTGERAVRWMTEEQIAELSDIQHSVGRCGGYMDITEHPSSRQEPVLVLPEVVGRQPSFGRAVQAAIGQLSVENVRGWVQTLSNQFFNRYNQSDSGAESSLWLQGQFITLAQGRPDVSVRLFKHNFKQSSVIATIAGSGPHAAEHVIVGAHLDSVNYQSDSATTFARAPGADDDASGIATLLETYRALMATGFKPARTIDFIGYAAEERGLLGSQDIAAKYKKDGIVVAGVFQMDMTAYPSSSSKITLISDYTSEGLSRFIATLIDTYVHVPWTTDRCGYGCSDHASWTRNGYASAFPFESPFNEHNPKIHSADDEIGLLNFDFSLNFAKLATAFAIELGSER